MTFQHLAQEERGQIQALWNEGHNQAEIARRLNRSRSTISREIQRSQEFTDFKRFPPKRRQHMYHYNAGIAGMNSQKRKENSGRKVGVTKEMAAPVYNSSATP